MKRIIFKTESLSDRITRVLIVSASVLFCLTAVGMRNTQLTGVGADSRQLATISATGSEILAVRGSGNESIATVKETLRFNRVLSLTSQQALISFSKGTERGEVFEKGDETLDRSYPCIRDFLEIVPSDDASHSFAVYKLFAETEELGRIQLAARYIDFEHSLVHQTKILSSTEDDASLSTKRTVQTFVTVAGEDKPVDITETSIPYTYRERTEDRYSDTVHDRRWRVIDYVRGNGETFSRDWQDLGLVVKRPAPPPVQPAAPVYQQVRYNNGPSNEFEKFAQNCVVI